MMERVLRGHHVLCVHGFKGLGYSPKFITKMTEIVNAVRSPKTFPIRVIDSLDDACRCCPFHGDAGCEASLGSDRHVKELDARVLRHLGIQSGQVLDKDDLVQLVALKVQPNDLDHLCRGCSWLAAGYCKAGIARLRTHIADV